MHAPHPSFFCRPNKSATTSKKHLHSFCNFAHAISFAKNAFYFLYWTNEILEPSRTSLQSHFCDDFLDLWRNTRTIPCTVHPWQLVNCFVLTSFCLFHNSEQAHHLLWAKSSTKSRILRFYLLYHPTTPVPTPSAAPISVVSLGPYSQEGPRTHSPNWLEQRAPDLLPKGCV